MKEFIIASMKLVMPPPSSHDDFYASHVAISPVESAELCQATCDQSGHKWLKARRVRMTASECHKWYIYEGDKWQQKVESHFMSRFTGSAATRYGQQNERAAITAYPMQQGECVVGCGLIVPPGAPWLGCSPDGVVCDANGVPMKLLEAKCPIMGKDHGLQAMASHPPPFLAVHGENLV